MLVWAQHFLVCKFFHELVMGGLEPNLYGYNIGA